MMNSESFRILRWRTLWGGRLPDSPVPPWMVTLVALLSLGPSLASLLGVDFGFGTRVEGGADGVPGGGQDLAWFVHVCLDWAAGLTALVVALFALFHTLTDRGERIATPVTVWLFVSLLDIYHGSLELTLPAGADDRPQVLVFSWLMSRLFLALALILGTWSLPRPGRPSRIGARMTVLGLGLGAVALLLAIIGSTSGRLPVWLAPGAEVARPGDLAALVLFLVAGLWVLPRYHRADPTIFSHALLVSTIPQVLAQLHMAFGARQLYDSHFMLAHGHKVLAYFVVLGGFGLAYGRAQRDERHAAREAQSAQLALSEKTQEIERIDRERDLQVAERQRAERNLRMLEKAVETMSLGLTVTDVDGRIIYVNPADARMHGYRPENLIGENAWVFNAERAQTPIPRPPEIVRWERERLNVRKDGSTFPVRLVSDAVFDEDERLAAVVTLCEDISEQRRIRDAIERRDRILQAVGVAAERFLADASWEERAGEVLERLGLATGVGRVYLGSVDTSAGYLPGGRERSWQSPDTELAPTGPEAAGALAPPYLFEGWRQRLARGQTLRGQVDELPRMERTPLLARGVRSYAVVPIFVQSAWWGFLGLEDSDPDREWSRAEIEALRVAARTLAAAIQRQETIEALAATEEKYREVLDNANDLIQSVAADGRFQYVNRAWREALGYEETEASRRTIADVVSPDTLKAYREVTRRIISGERRGRVEATFVSKSGKEIPVEGNLNCRLQDGKVVAIRGIFRDISERKAVDRLKQEFISTISHDLRTPLTSVIAALGLLENTFEEADSARSEELIAVAQRNSSRLLRLINDLLDLQKLSAGKMRFKVAEVSVAPLLAEAAQGIRAFADSAGVRLEVAELSSHLELLADRDRLMQVLNNLLSNAIKFSPSGELVRLGASGQDGSVVLSVEDHGPGIPESFREHLFDRFTQAEIHTSYRSGGSGLGLSIVKALVEGMQGEVTLETEVGRGTTFYVHLPRVGSGAEDAESAEPPS